MPAAGSAAARQLVAWLDELGRISDEPGRLTRTFLSPAMRRANACVARWMRSAGLAVREDAGGNLLGRLTPSGADGPVLVLGSHLDTVRDAGRVDGALGVLLPLVAVSELRRRGRELAVPLEIAAFAEEEGVRFASAYLGSKAYTGRLAAGDLDLRDAEGASVRAALTQFQGGRFVMPAAAHPPGGVRGYVEVHIEQGPVLEAARLPVGVVSAIAGQTRGRLTFRGQAGHAGTTPMRLRKDALAGAAEFVLLAERLARAQDSLVATVGTLEVSPGAPNVIPGEVVLSLDVRHPRDADRRAALRELLAGARMLARARGLQCTWQVTQDHGAVDCDTALTRQLETSVRRVAGRTLSLPSGAGHDAVVLAQVAPVAMLFVRCRGGLSHHPDEYASPADLAVALEVMIDFLSSYARPIESRVPRPPSRRRPKPKHS